MSLDSLLDRTDFKQTPRRALPTSMCFEILNGNQAGRSLHVNHEYFAIGSSENCSLRLKAPGVRGEHCVVYRGPNHTTVNALSPDTLLNDLPFTETELSDGDVLTVGAVRVEVSGLDTVVPAPTIEEIANRSDQLVAHAERICQDEFEIDENARPESRSNSDWEEQQRDYEQRIADVEQRWQQQQQQFDNERQEWEQTRTAWESEVQAWQDERQSLQSELEQTREIAEQQSPTSDNSTWEEQQRDYEQRIADVEQRWQQQQQQFDNERQEWEQTRTAWESEVQAWQDERQSLQSELEQTREIAEQQSPTSDNSTWEEQQRDYEQRIADVEQRWQQQQQQFDNERQEWEQTRTAWESEVQAWQDERQSLQSELEQAREIAEQQSPTSDNSDWEEQQRDYEQRIADVEQRWQQQQQQFDNERQEWEQTRTAWESEVQAWQDERQSLQSELEQTREIAEQQSPTSDDRDWEEQKQDYERRIAGVEQRWQQQQQQFDNERQEWEQTRTAWESEVQAWQDERQSLQSELEQTREIAEQQSSATNNTDWEEQKQDYERRIADVESLLAAEQQQIAEQRAVWQQASETWERESQQWRDERDSLLQRQEELETRLAQDPSERPEPTESPESQVDDPQWDAIEQSYVAPVMERDDAETQSSTATEDAIDPHQDQTVDAQEMDSVLNADVTDPLDSKIQTLECDDVERPTADVCESQQPDDDQENEVPLSPFAQSLIQGMESPSLEATRETQQTRDTVPADQSPPASSENPEANELQANELNEPFGPESSEGNFDPNGTKQFDAEATTVAEFTDDFVGDDDPEFGGPESNESEVDDSLVITEDADNMLAQELDITPVMEEPTQAEAAARTPGGSVSAMDVLKKMGHDNLWDEEDSLDNEAPMQQTNATPIQESPVEASTNDEDDGSIDEYMSRLLQRVQGTSEADAPSPVPAPAAPEPKAELEEKTTAAVEPSPTPPEPAERPLTPAEFVPARKAPEASDGFSAMRELANNNARSAITTANKRKHSNLIMALVALTVVCSGIGVGLFVCTFILGSPMLSIVGLGFLGGGIYAGLQTAKLWKTLVVANFRERSEVKKREIAEMSAGDHIPEPSTTPDSQPLGEQATAGDSQ